MTRWASEHALKELVTAVVGADDPQLYDRACSALGALLAEHNEAGVALPLDP